MGSRRLLTSLIARQVCSQWLAMHSLQPSQFATVVENLDPITQALDSDDTSYELMLSDKCAALRMDSACGPAQQLTLLHPAGARSPSASSQDRQQLTSANSTTRCDPCGQLLVGLCGLSLLCALQDGELKPGQKGIQLRPPLWTKLRNCADALLAEANA